MGGDSVFVLGIDVGSLTAKAVVLDGGGGMRGYSVVQTGIVSQQAAQASVEQALARAAVGRSDICYAVATGYGRARVDWAQGNITEISCHARGAHHLLPQARMVIDIGGQDSKVIALDQDGLVVSFVMNDKCAAGTGRFLEVMARALEVNLGEMGQLSLQAQNPCHVSSMCTVFAESEVISLVAEGHSKADIIAGLHEAIARRLVAMVKRVGNPRNVVMTGGVAKNVGMVRALEGLLGTTLTLPPEPQIVGALGAALFAMEQVQEESFQAGLKGKQ